MTPQFIFNLVGVIIGAEFVIAIGCLFGLGYYRTDCERPSGMFPNLWLSDEILVAAVVDFVFAIITLSWEAYKGVVPRYLRAADFLFGGVWCYGCLVPTLSEFGGCLHDTHNGGIYTWIVGLLEVVWFNVWICRKATLEYAD